MPTYWKPEPRKRTKARRGRVESKVAQAVRAQCVARDGSCRLGYPDLWEDFGVCGGSSEWAHLGDARRFRTRGQAPEKRHSTAGSLCLCSRHHDQLDGRARPRIDIQAASSHGADGRLAFCCDGTVYLEPERVGRERAEGDKSS